jgi:hypothetical protein
VNENKKQFISLLLLADEQENMIDCYLEKGTMVDIFNPDTVTLCKFSMNEKKHPASLQGVRILLFLRLSL